MITHNMTDRELILTLLRYKKLGLYSGCIPFKYSLCDTCYSEITTTKQMELNNRIMWEFKYACQKLDLDSELTLQRDSKQKMAEIAKISQELDLMGDSDYE